MQASRLRDDYYYEDYDYEYEREDREEQQPKKSKLKAVKVDNKEDKPFILNTRLRSRAQVFFVVFAVLAMAVTVRSGISASRGYALVATQTQAQNVEQENERLRVEIAKLKAPARIQGIAESELGMKAPQKVYFAHEK